MMRAAIVLLGAIMMVGGSGPGAAAACPRGTVPVSVGPATASAEDSTLGYVCMQAPIVDPEVTHGVRNDAVEAVGADMRDEEKQTYGYVRTPRPRT